MYLLCSDRTSVTAIRTSRLHFTTNDNTSDSLEHLQEFRVDLAEERQDYLQSSSRMAGHIVERESSAPGVHEKKTKNLCGNATVGQCM